MDADLKSRKKRKVMVNLHRTPLTTTTPSLSVSSDLWKRLMSSSILPRNQILFPPLQPRNNLVEKMAIPERARWKDRR